MPSNREFVRSLYDAFARGDADTVLAGLAPDVEWNEAKGSPYADMNPYRGPEEVGNDGKITAFQQYTDTAQYQRLANSG